VKNLTIFFLLICVILGGCVVPYPHFVEISRPISGCVVIEDSNIPIKNAVVKAYYSDKSSRKTKTDKDGFFYVPSKKQLRMFLVAPNDNFYESFKVTVKVKAKGYSEKKLTFWHRNIPMPIRDTSISDFKNNVYALERIKPLNKK